MNIASWLTWLWPAVPSLLLWLLWNKVVHPRLFEQHPKVYATSVGVRVSRADGRTASVTRLRFAVQNILPVNFHHPFVVEVKSNSGGSFVEANPLRVYSGPGTGVRATIDGSGSRMLISGSGLRGLKTWVIEVDTALETNTIQFRTGIRPRNPLVGTHVQYEDRYSYTPWQTLHQGTTHPEVFEPSRFLAVGFSAFTVLAVYLVGMYWTATGAVDGGASKLTLDEALRSVEQGGIPHAAFAALFLIWLFLGYPSAHRQPKVRVAQGYLFARYERPIRTDAEEPGRLAAKES